MSPSARIVLSQLPGTVLDISMRARMNEGTVRARMAELRRAGLVLVAGRLPPAARGGMWARYARA